MSAHGTLVRICVTGPESTGKTTLAAALAARLRTVWVPEASRIYAARKATSLLASDVGPIARAQVALDDEASEEAARLGASHLVLDTDLLSTVVYAWHYYDAVPRWVQRAEHARRADLYLLCDIGVPWVADGVRDRPANRREMHELFARALRRRASLTVPISGSADLRLATAMAAVARLAAGPARRKAP